MLVARAKAVEPNAIHCMAAVFLGSRHAMPPLPLRHAIQSMV